MSRRASNRAKRTPQRPPSQLPLEFRSHGGRRPGAGRPKDPESGVPHLERPRHSRHHPVHVTLRVRADVPALTSRRRFRQIQRAFAAGRDRFGFRLAQFSVRRNHLHLIVEARDRRALSRGMQGLAIRLARAVNRASGRRGKVFADRYHARPLRTPRETKSALRYVLLNARRHDRRTGPPHGVPLGVLDGFASGMHFDGWNWLPDRPLVVPSLEPGPDPPVARARTWLLRVGWRRHGLLDLDDLPGPAPSNGSSPR